MKSVVQTLGSLDHVLCFAGIVGCHHAAEMTAEQWRKTLDVNTTGMSDSQKRKKKKGKKGKRKRKKKGKLQLTSLTSSRLGSFLTAQKAHQQMRSQTPPGGTITLIGSISAHRVNFPQPQAAYNVSKAGIVALVKSLAAEWAVDGVRVNSISPGYQDTILNAGEGKIREARAVWNERNPMGRMGAVGEMDGMCVLLCSRAGSYMTGSDYVIDGEFLFSFFIFSFLLLGCFFPLLSLLFIYTRGRSQF